MYISVVLNKKSKLCKKKKKWVKIILFIFWVFKHAATLFVINVNEPIFSDLFRRWACYRVPARGQPAPDLR
jgi:hypothetical protein